MAGVRQTIELLLKILHSNGTSKVKAETFRLAKLNYDESTEPLWKLLFEILYYLKYDAVDDVTVKAYSELTKHELTVYVKAEMKLYGFRSKDFHALPADMSSGSRELLLALGWLLCHCNVLERFMKNCSSPLTAAIDASNKETLAKQDRDVKHTCGQYSLEPSSVQTPEAKLKYLKWLNGKLRMSLRQLHVLHQERSRLSDSISEATRGANLVRGRDHLTPLEAALLQNPDLLRHNMKLLERDNARLECLLQWPGTHDETFWRWMSSVLDAKLSEGGRLAIDEELSPRYNTATHRQLADKVNLLDAIRNYEEIIKHIESLYLTEHPPSQWTDDIDSLLASLEAEIAVQKATIALSITSHTATVGEAVGSARTRHIGPGSMFRTSDGGLHSATESEGCSVSSRAEPSDGRMDAVDSQLNELQALMEKLQRDIEYKKRAYVSDLSVLSSDAEDVVVTLPGASHFRS